MRLTIQGIRTTLLFSIAPLLVAFGSPLIVAAEDAPIEVTEQAIVIPTETTLITETIVEAPAEEISTTGQTTPPAQPEEPVYTYNPETGMWDSDKWYFDSSTGTYKAVEKPAEVITIDEASTTDTDITNQADINNNLTADATTGDASVNKNSTAGDATSGDAASIATILNNINSVLGLNGGQGIASFSTDITGNVTGDIILQPEILKALLNAAVGGGDSKVNINNDSSIANNINMSATSGDADVTKNTTAGNATSGNATAILNLINIINSMIASGQSFFGAINIYGNLTGDILISPDFISQLLANNGQATPDENSTSSTINSTDTQTITNNVNLSAESGQAVVNNNTEAGSATSGDTTTNLVILNFSGHEVIAENSLLVFVNVLGNWYGIIVDAPANATAGVIGSGVASDTLIIPNLDLNSNNTSEITNNINLSAMTGDANVSENTKAGNAISGNAIASANIANLIGSQFGLTGWFGVLFINVFGSWYGSFGVNTPYGDPIVTPGTTETPEVPEVITFIPTEVAQAVNPVVLGVTTESNNTPEITVTTETIQEVSVKKDTGSILASAIKKENANNLRIILLASSLFLIAISAAGARQIFFKKAE